MKDLFDLRDYDNGIAEALLLELEVLGGDAKRDLVEGGAHRWMKTKIGEDAYVKSELAVTARIHGMMVELLGKNMMVEHGCMVRMTRMGRLARRMGYEKATAEKKTLTEKIKEVNEMASAVLEVSVTAFKIIAAAILLLAALGIVSLSSSTIELLQSLL